MALKISALEEKIKGLVQEIALRDAGLGKNETEPAKEDGSPEA